MADYSGLGALLPEYQDMYKALAPQIERSVNADTAARGMSSSGAPAELATRQQQELLAKLAGESASAKISQSEREKDRSASASAANKSLIASGIGAGVGGIGSLAGLYYMMHRGGGAQNLIPIGPGKYGQLIDGKIQEVPVGSGAAATAGKGVPMDSVSGSPGMGWGDIGKTAALGAGAGYIGSELGKNIGAKGMAGDIGAGLGGLAGLGAGYEIGGGNPWASAIGAGVGAFGGRGLSGLFA